MRDFKIKTSLKDPLSEVSRKNRKLLLIVSLIGITLVKTGLVPEKISGWGIEFTKANQEAILLIVGLITIYQMISFLIYATSDFLSIKIETINKISDELKSKVEEIEKRFEFQNKHAASIEDLPEFRDVSSEFERQLNSNRKSLVFIKPTYFSRIGWDFLIPLFVSIYSLYLILPKAL